MCENTRRSTVIEILKPALLAAAIMARSKSLRSHFFLILMVFVYLKLLQDFFFHALLPHVWLKVIGEVMVVTH